MRLLLCLAEKPGEVVSIDALLNHVWSGVIVTPDSVYQAVASLRRLLGDDPKQPAYIVTVPRLGYRLVATVDSRMNRSAPPDRAEVTTDKESGQRIESASRVRMYALVAAGMLLVAGCLIIYAFVFHAPTPGAGAAVASTNEVRNPKSIAVLPFLDLTDTMNEEPFADGMTEELIDKLSKVQGLRVPPPTSSFYFKGKQVTVADIAKSLGVSHVLDGSVRKSGDTLRVAARLVRADDGYVVWSETYDRPLGDKLMVQDDIANEVTRALRASID